MRDSLKKIFTYGTAAGVGYYLGKNIGENSNPKKTLFSRFIPTVIFASGIAYFAVKVPNTIDHVITTSSNNNTRIELQRDSLDARIKEKALEKGINIYGNKTKEFDDLQRQFEAYKKEVKKNTQTLFDIGKEQNKKLEDISEKLNEINYASNNNASVPRKNSNNNTSRNNIGRATVKGINTYNTWSVFNKRDQKFYFYKNRKLVGSGYIILNGNGNPPRYILFRR